MAFERLQSLGEERFRKVLNELMRGTACMVVARMIQQEWGEFQDVAEKTLTQQVTRLKKSAVAGAFGKELAKQIEDSTPPVVIAKLETASIGVLDRLEELAAQHHARVSRFIEKESSLPMPVVGLMQQTTHAMEAYKETLKDIQKSRFDLGLDEYKGVSTSVRGAAQSITYPDGTRIDQQVMEAVTTMQEIFAKRKIGPPN